MSGEMALWAARQDIPNLVAKMTLIALADSYQDLTGACFPSHETLSEFVRRGRTQIKEAIKWLEKDGWIKKTSRFAANGRQTSNGYEIIFDRGISMPEWYEKRKKSKGVGNPTGIGNPTGVQSEIRPDEQPETRPPLTNKNRTKGADAPSASGAENGSSGKASPAAPPSHAQALCRLIGPGALR